MFLERGHKDKWDPSEYAWPDVEELQYYHKYSGALYAVLCSLTFGEAMPSGHADVPQSGGRLAIEVDVSGAPALATPAQATIVAPAAPPIVGSQPL